MRAPSVTRLKQVWRRRQLGAAKRSGHGGARWVAGVAFLVVLGVAVSGFAARAVARNDTQKSQRAFAASSADIASRLRLAIQHEEDLVVSTSAFIATNPSMSSATFNHWLHTDRASERYPEILSVVRIVIVPATQLPAYTAQHLHDPAGSRAGDGSFHVLPPGDRAFYCFADLRSNQPLSNGSPAGTDSCSGTAGAGLLRSRDSGQGLYEPFQVGKLTLLGIETPIYRGGVVPATITSRRALFIGWIGTGLMPKTVLDTAAEAHPATALTLRYTRSSTGVAFSRGTSPHNGRSLTTDLHNGWTVQTAATLPQEGVFSNTKALALLLGGVALTGLLGLLGFVLATGRIRALRLVRKQTVELREQASELRATVDELEAAQAIKDEFLGLVSHELRTPITSIRGYVELLQEEALEDEQRNWLNVIEASSLRLESLVDDLLLMAQIQSGGLPLRLGEVILSDLIARSSEAAKPFAASKEIELDVNTEPDVTAQGDSTRLGQVLDNLISNAIKYTPNGGDVAIPMMHTGDTATIAVRDTGIGIPKDEQDQMFSRFFRTTNARLSGIQGTGLGLAITRGIIEAHGGTINFESIEGTGTTFHFTLPLTNGHKLAALV